MKRKLTETKLYRRVHKNLINRYGNAKKCQNRKCKGTCKRFEWALKKGRSYSDNPEDYLHLCSSCHKIYDYTESRRRKFSKLMIGNKRATRRAIVQFDLAGKYINEFESIRLAALTLKIYHSNISHCLAGRRKSTGGFIWKTKSTKP